MRIVSPELVKDLVSKGKRVDSRKFMEYRKIESIVGYVKKAEGSCYVSIGDTKVVVGVKFGVMTPYPDTPDKGGMMVTLNYSPVIWKELPQNRDIEVSRVLDRSIRESKMLDLKDFCITPGEKVFQIFIDCYVMNYDGNLLDALNLAAVKAFMSANMPKMEDDKAVPSDKKIKLNSFPVEVTVSKIGGKYIMDLNRSEEDAVDFSVMISYLDEKTICAMQKVGILGIPFKEMEEIFKIGVEKQAELRKLLKE